MTSKNLISDESKVADWSENMLLKNSWQVGRVAGIPVYINFTWFWILLPIAASLALGYIPARYPWFSPASTWAVSISATCLLFLSVLGHELLHAIVARRNGIPVERISLFLFGGVAVLRREPASAWIEVKMAAAGPLCSLLLGAVLALVYVLLTDMSATSPPLALVEYLAIVNLALAFFNLLPAFPLDGGRLLRAAIWVLTGNFRRATRAASALAQGLALLLIFWGLFRLINGIVSDEATSTSWIANTWIVMTGWFLSEAARAGYGDDSAQPNDTGEGEGSDERNLEDS